MTPSSLRLSRRYLAPLALAALVLGLVPAPAAAEDEAWLPDWQRRVLADSDRVGRPLVDALERSERVRVLVTFEVPSPRTGAARHRFASPGAKALLRDAGDVILRQMPEGSFTVTRRFGAVAALAGEIDAAGVVALLERPEVTAVDVDEMVYGALEEAIPLANIPPVQGLGFKGRGVVVAVIDTGADFKHKALKKARAGEECICFGCCPDGSSRDSGRNSARDDNGHGSHVGGIIVSRGRGGVPDGVATKAKLLAIKTLDADNAGFTSDSIAALDWILDSGADVDLVNMSLSSNTLYRGNCDKRDAATRAYRDAINALWDLGIPVFAASGNSGSRNKMGAPACVKNAISVGAVYDEDFFSADWGVCEDPTIDLAQITCFSNTGRTTDMVAPGALITSVAAGGGADAFSGTSQASPMAAGCAALLKEAFPDVSTKDLRAALRSGGKVRDDKNGRRFPLLDCEAALDFLAGL